MGNNAYLKRCIRCGNSCCHYFTVQVPTPRSIIDFDCLLWQLYHDNVKVFKDSTGWHLLIYNSCVHLTGDGKCSVYEDRPITCREHPYERCEFGSSIAKSVDLFFDDYQSLERFCRKRFKRWDRRFR